MAALCFVHCVVGPVLLSFAGFASLTASSEKIEPLFILSSLAIGTATLIPGYRHRHGRITCLVLFFCGVICLAVLRRREWPMVPEWVLAGIGAALIAGAHALNRRFARECGCCQSPAREHELRTLR